MDQPLGRFSGSWLEVQECVDCLQGRIHPLSTDLLELSFTLSGHMLLLAGHASSAEAGYALAAQLLHSGKAYAAWLRIVAAQGGDVSVFTEPSSHHRPRFSRTVHAPRASYLASMDCKEVGWAVQQLGAGRSHPEAPVVSAAGLELHAKLGTFMHAGQPIVTLFGDDPARLEQSASRMEHALQWSADAPALSPLIHEVL